jgi:hypothetical protein
VSVDLARVFRITRQLKTQKSTEHPIISYCEIIP